MDKAKKNKKEIKIKKRPILALSHLPSSGYKGISADSGQCGLKITYVGTHARTNGHV